MKCNVKNRPMSEEELERFRKENIKSADRYLNYIQRIVLTEIRKAYGFGKERMARMNNNGFELGSWYIERYSPEDVHREDEEYAVDAYYAIRRDLRAFGFDPDEEFWPDGRFYDMIQPQPSHALRKKAMDYADYAERLSFYVRELLCMLCLELHETDKYGVERLRRVMRPTRDRWLALMGSYMEMDGKSVCLEMRRALDEFNMLGVFKKEYTL